MRCSAINVERPSRTQGDHPHLAAARLRGRARRLGDDGYPAAVVTAVLERAADLGFLDDTRFADALTRFDSIAWAKPGHELLAGLDDDGQAAAVQFLMLCQGDLLARSRLGILPADPGDEMRATVTHAVRTFLRAYRP